MSTRSRRDVDEMSTDARAPAAEARSSAPFSRSGVRAAAVAGARPAPAAEAEEVPDAVHGEDVDRRLGGELDLLPEPQDVGVDRARRGVLLPAPDLVEEPPALDGLALVGEEEAQDVELLAREAAAHALQVHRVGPEVDRGLAD